MSETTRRAVLAGAAGVTAVGVLAACGDDDSGGDSGSSSAGGTSAKVAKADVPVGGGKIVSDAGGVVVTQPEAGTFKAFSAICTHQNCVVTSVADNAINCKCHGSVFSAADGSVKNGPATTALKEKKVTVDGDNLTVTA